MFKFKNISSEDMSIVVEEESLLLARAAHKYDIIQIEGKDGDIVDVSGYSNIERTIKIQVLDKNKLDNIFSWLDGEGELEYNNRISKAYFLQFMEPIRNSSIYIIDYMFIREPFWYKANDEFIIVTENVINEGNQYSSPIIRLEKGNDNVVELSIADVRLLYDFQEEDYVEIDCKEMIATYENISRNQQLIIGYEYPKIYPGENKITIHSGDPTIKIRRKDCWL